MQPGGQEVNPERRKPAEAFAIAAANAVRGPSREDCLDALSVWSLSVYVWELLPVPTADSIPCETDFGGLLTGIPSGFTTGLWSIPFDDLVIDLRGAVRNTANGRSAG